MDTKSFDLFDSNTTRPGSLGCIAEIAGAINDALRRAADRGVGREEVASRMTSYLGEPVSVGTLNGFCAPSHTTQAKERGVPERHINFMRAMAFGAAIEEDVLLGLFCAKRGNRVVISSDDANLLEWARLHHQEKDLAERRKTLEAALKLKART